MGWGGGGVGMLQSDKLVLRPPLPVLLVFLDAPRAASTLTLQKAAGDVFLF